MGKVVEIDEGILDSLNKPRPIDLETTDLVALPEGLTLHSTKAFRDALRDRPERREGDAKFTTLESFCEHANRFKDEHSAIFADEANANQPRLISVLDYHEKTADGDPRFGKHRGWYSFPLADEWKAWKALDGKPLSQAQFAELLEDRIIDVLDPSNIDHGSEIAAVVMDLGVNLAPPSRLLGLARGLSLRVESKVVNAVNLSSGEMQVTYEESHRDKESNAPLTIPNGFAIGIPVFRNGDRYKVFVRLRYRASGGNLSWTVALHRLDRVFEHAFREACEGAKKLTELPLFYGTPE